MGHCCLHACEPMCKLNWPVNSTGHLVSIICLMFCQQVSSQFACAYCACKNVTVHLTFLQTTNLSFFTLLSYLTVCTLVKSWMSTPVQFLKLPYKGHNITNRVRHIPPRVRLEEPENPPEDVKYCDVDESKWEE